MSPRSCPSVSAAGSTARRSAYSLLLCLQLLFCGACGDEQPDAVETPVTYHADLRPLIEASCLGCHTAGGIGPFDLDSWEAVSLHRSAVVSAVETRQMPPWIADDDCHPVEHSRAFSADERAIFTDWRDDGFVEGDVATYVAPDRRDAIELGEPDRRGRPAQAFVADLSSPDDWRCLAVEMTFEESTFVYAADVAPGATDIVHHVVVYLVEAAAVAELEERDEEGGEPGYDCYGGPEVGGGVVISGWVPGSLPQVYPDGAAIHIPAGSRLVMQMHYNFANLDDDAPVPPDQSELMLWTYGEDEVPEYLVNILPIGFYDLEIDAGDPDSVQQMFMEVPFEATLVGVLPHMHTLGESVRVDLHHAADDTDECVVNIPQWDFDWQQIYTFSEENFIETQPGDRFTMTCVYDNSAANQPVINGERSEPMQVSWGEQTNDEMCLNYLVTLFPFYGGEGICAGVDACLPTCDATDSTCGAGCLLGSGLGCTFCIFENFLPCATEACPVESGQMLLCVGASDDVINDLQTECRDEFDAFFECIHPVMVSGACDEVLTTCELAFDGDFEAAE